MLDLRYMSAVQRHLERSMRAGSRVRHTSPQTLGYWHLARLFDPDNPPALNQEFFDIQDDLRYAAVQNMPPFIIAMGHNIRRVAPLPIMSVPGRMDHN